MGRYLSRHRIPIILGLGVTLFGLWLLLTDNQWVRTAVNRLDYLAYDLRLNLSLPSLDKNELQAVIIDIDEASLRAEGRWPWSRQKIGQLLEALDRQGVRTVGFDIAFTEPERNIARELLQDEALRNSASPAQRQFLEQLETSVDRDREFARQLESRNVVLGLLFHADGEPAGTLPPPWAFAMTPETEKIMVPSMPSYTGNLQILQDAAFNGGFLNTTLDDDGLLRASPLLIRHTEGIYPSLALAVAGLHKGALRFKIETVDLGEHTAVTGLLLEDYFISTDQYGRVLVPYLGQSGSIVHISATDVLQAEGPGRFPELQDAAVIVGSSALGLADLVSSPIQPAFPGVEVQASILQHLLAEGTFAHEPDWGKAAKALLIAGLGTVLTLTLPALGALSLTIVVLGLIAALLAGNFWIWSSWHLALSPMLPLLTIIAIAFLDIAYGFFAEAKQKLQVRRAFSHYLAPTLVQQLTDQPEKLQTSGEKREMTFLFTDIAGFTSFTESTDPKILVLLLNEYLDVVCQLVMSHGGTIDKIVGDAVHVIFNAPIDQPDHPARAVNCALAIDRFATEFMLKKRQQGLDFGITRIGVNSGPAVVGNFGGSSRFDYTAHGDAINTAARLESVNRYFGTRICVSGNTAQHCPAHFFRPIGELILKGKTEAIETYEPVSEEESHSPRVERYLAAYEHLKNEQPDAGQMFSELLDSYPDDPLLQYHAARISHGETGTTIAFDKK